MIVFDTEDNSPELLAAGKSGFLKEVTQIAAICSNGKTFYNKGNVTEFLKWCKSFKDDGKNHDVWAFNAQYDIGNLCNKASQLNLWDFDVTMVKGRFIKGVLKGLNFYDVHNLSGAGSSVGKMGLAVRLPKFGFQYSKEDFSTFSSNHQKEYLEFQAKGNEKFRDKCYVFRDCEIPLRWLNFIQERCDELGLEKVPATLGTLCTKTFSALGNENWFESGKCDCLGKCECRTSANALIGARVELFSGGGSGRIAYVDINSLYPWCMTQKFPTTAQPLNDISGYGIAQVTMQVPKCRVAPLPMKDDESRLIFPYGKFTGIWTCHEIRNAIGAGAKMLKFHWALGSKDGKNYYQNYILKMYQNRLACKTPAESLFWKLLMNNLYGRLAISGVVSRSLNLTEENLADGIPYGTKILCDNQMPLPAFTNYLHAAHVLSYARVLLFSYLKKIPEDDLIYCDTDSVIFFCKGDLPFPVGKELGAMKLEGWGKKCIPYLPKTYVFDDTYKAKGVPKKNAKEFIESGSTEYDLPFKLREAIRFYEDNNSRKLSVWRKVEKIRAAVYDRKKISGKYFLPKKVNFG
jgi:hypothetical protein